MCGVSAVSGEGEQIFILDSTSQKGFANSAAGILNLWFDQHFPNAIKVAEELRNTPSTNARLRFTAQSYVVSLYLECPPDMGLHCPSADQVRCDVDRVEGRMKKKRVRLPYRKESYPFMLP